MSDLFEVFLTGTAEFFGTLWPHSPRAWLVWLGLALLTALVLLLVYGGD